LTRVAVTNEVATPISAAALISEMARHRLLLGFLVLAFLLGGSSRADVASLALLRPIAAVAVICLAALAWRDAMRVARGPALLLATTIVLVFLHVIPLPPSVWTALPGRAVVVETMAVVGNSPGWLPLTLAPVEGWNQLFALTVPAAALLAMVWAGVGAVRPVIMLVLAVILASALLGLLQSIGPANSPLYLYRITNNGVGVGLFANRNHQAMLLACSFPLLAVWASTITGSADSQRAKSAVALGLGLALVPLVFVTGSRSGLALAFVGILCAFIVFQRPKAGFRARGQEMSRRVVGMTVAATALIMTLVAALSTRSVALQRIVESDPADDLRFQALPTIIDAVGQYFPFGSGAGSFVPVYKLFEPDALLSAAYFNHAHNDVVEVALEYGLPGVVLMLASVAMWGRAVIQLWQNRRSAPDSRDRVQIFGWAGASILLILGLGSVVDYPLRVPSLACLAALATVWVAMAVRPNSKRRSGDSHSPEYPLAADADKESY
jgi:O-antigen ligase